MFFKIVGRVNGNSKTAYADVKAALLKFFPTVEVTIIDFQIEGDYDTLVEVVGTHMDRRNDSNKISEAFKKTQTYFGKTIVVRHGEGNSSSFSV